MNTEFVKIFNIEIYNITDAYRTIYKYNLNKISNAIIYFKIKLGNDRKEKCPHCNSPLEFEPPRLYCTNKNCIGFNPNQFNTPTGVEIKNKLLNQKKIDIKNKINIRNQTDVQMFLKYVNMIFEYKSDLVQFISPFWTEHRMGYQPAITISYRKIRIIQIVLSNIRNCLNENFKIDYDLNLKVFNKNIIRTFAYIKIKSVKDYDFDYNIDMSNYHLTLPFIKLRYIYKTFPNVLHRYLTYNCDMDAHFAKTRSLG